MIRTIDTLQLNYNNPTIACGVNWMVGEDVFITNDVSNATAKELFPNGFVEIRPWFRLAPPPVDPNSAEAAKAQAAEAFANK